MTDHPIMKCGCAAQGVKTAEHGVKLEKPIPCCITHDCVEVADAPPDLTGRFATCTYLPRGHAKKPSSNELAFFEYCGPGSRKATEMCKCGYAWIAHQPRWLAVINVDRGARKESVTRSFHAPEDMKVQRAESEAEFFRRQSGVTAVVGEIRPERSSLKCRQFVARGPLEFDRYYCGCHGWD